MIHLEQRHKKIIMNIFSHYHYHFYAFGSRVKGTHRKLSDLDLCYMDPIPLKDIVKLEAELEESDLPFKVDLIDYTHCSPAFKDIIKKDIIPLKIMD